MQQLFPAFHPFRFCKYATRGRKYAEFTFSGQVLDAIWHRSRGPREQSKHNLLVRASGLSTPHLPQKNETKRNVYTYKYSWFSVYSTLLVTDNVSISWLLAASDQIVWTFFMWRDVLEVKKGPHPQSFYLWECKLHTETLSANEPTGSEQKHFLLISLKFNSIYWSGSLVFTSLSIAFKRTTIGPILIYITFKFLSKLWANISWNTIKRKKNNADSVLSTLRGL